jgi:general secretion pathway protein L
MPDRLLLRLDRSGGLTWLRQSTDGRMLSSSQKGAPPTAVLASAGELVVLVPAEDVLLIQARITARSAAQLQQAVPFAVEDQLLGPIEEQHFAFRLGNDGMVGVAVVSKRRMRAWLDQLQASGIRADVLLPESLALPLGPESACAIIDEGHATARLDPWSSISCASAAFPAWIAQARLAGIDRALEVHDFGAGAPLALDGRISAYQSGQRDPLAFLARHLRMPPVNLLCAEFASGHRQARGVRWWRRVAILAAVILLTAFVQRGIEVGQLSRSVEQVNAAMSASLNETFPDLGAAERQRAPQSVMRDRLERLRGGSEAGGLLRLLGQIAPILGRTSRTQVRGVEFRNGILEMGLRSPDVATLDSTREQFAAIPGLSAEVTASVPTDSAVDGRIRIRGVGP